MEHQHQHQNLQELKHSDYHIIDDQPDIEGWSIFDAVHDKIGRVHDLLFDPASRKVRYIIASVQDNLSGVQSKQVLIPIGMAELHEKDDEVIVPSVSTQQVFQFSPYPFDALKNNVVQGSVITLDNEAEHPDFNDEHFYRNRSMQANPGGAIIPEIGEQSRADEARVKTGGIKLRSRNAEQPAQDAPGSMSEA